MLLKKSEENLNAAELLHKNEMYNSVVHCAYYSCYQLMVKIDNSSEQYKWGKNSHEKVINYFISYIKTNNRTQFSDFQSNITRLKNKRGIADYNKSEEISSTISEECIESSKKVQSILKKIFKV